jgi:translocation and assembly module TamB
MKWLLAALGLLIALLGLGAAWLLGTQSGLDWSARQAAAASAGRLTASGLRGALAGDIAFDEIRFRQGDTDVRLASGELEIELLALLGGRAVLRLQAESLDVDLGEKGEKRTTAPALPLSIHVRSAQLARVRFQNFAIEDLELSDATVSPHGALSASASFAVREAAYPARVQVRLAGSLQRIEAAVSASIADIPISAQAVLQPFAELPLRTIDARAGPADLSALDPQWPRTALTAELNGAADGAQALAGTLVLRNAAPGPLDHQRIPLATLEARFASDLASISLQDMRITGAGSLSGSARLDRSRAQLELLASGLDLKAIRSTLRRTRLAGPLTVVATSTAQTVRGTLSQDGMSLGAEAVREGDVVEIRSLRATAEGGEATGSGRLHLGEPPRFEARLRLAGFDPARFGDYPEGSLNGVIEASGSLQDDFAVDARWQIGGSTLFGKALASRGSARFMRQRVSGADAQAQLGDARLVVRGSFGGQKDGLELELEVPEVSPFIAGISGHVQASGSLAGTWDRPRGSVQARGTRLALPNGLALEPLEMQAKGALDRHDVDIRVKAQDVELTAALRGGWRAESGWTGELRALRNVGEYPLVLTQAAPLSISPGRVELGRLQAKLGAGRLLVRQATWSQARLASSGEVEGLPAQWLILAAGLADRVKASLLLDAQWDLAAEPRLEGVLTVRRRSGDVMALPDELALELEMASFEARLAAGAATFTAAIGSRYGNVEARGTLQDLARDAPLAFTAKIRLAELRTLLQPFLQDARLDGRVAAELQGSGTLREVRLSGSLEGNGIAVQVPPYGVFLRDGELRAELEGDRLRVTRFSIRGSGGRLTGSGTLPLRADDGAHLDWRAEAFGLLARPDLRLTVSGAGEARLERRRFSLSGALRADRGYLELERNLLPQLGEDVVIVGQPREPARASAAQVPVGLDVRLDLGEHLEVRGYGLEGRLAGQLQVETTREGELRAYGRIHTVNATFLAYGQRLQVDPGIAIFDGPLDNPALQLTAWRRNQQVEAGVQISGTARAPRVQLVSQPPVPEAERLSWLVLGRGPGEATKADLGLLQAAAGALLARGDQLPLDRRIAQAFGVDEISLRGSGEVGDRVVAVGKRLSDRLYVSYEHGLGIVASSLVKLDFALSQRWSARAETGTSSGVGLFYRFSWD